MAATHKLLSSGQLGDDVTSDAAIYDPSSGKTGMINIRTPWFDYRHNTSFFKQKVTNYQLPVTDYMTIQYTFTDLRIRKHMGYNSETNNNIYSEWIFTKPDSYELFLHLPLYKLWE